MAEEGDICFTYGEFILVVGMTFGIVALLLYLIHALLGQAKTGDSGPPTGISSITTHFPKSK